MKQCITLLFMFAASHAIGQVTADLRKADSLFLAENYSASLPFRIRHMQSLPTSSTKIAVQKARKIITEFYIKQENKTSIQDSTLLLEALQLTASLEDTYTIETAALAAIAQSSYYSSNNISDRGIPLLKKFTSPPIEKKCNSNTIVLLNYTLASIYATAKNHPQSLLHYNKAIAAALQKDFENKNILAFLYNDIGLVYENLGQFDKNIDCYKKAHGIWWTAAYQQQYIGSNISVLGNLVAALSDYGNHKEAKQYLDTLLNYFQRVQRPPLSHYYRLRTPQENWKTEIFILLTSIRCHAAANNENAMMESLAQMEKKFAPPISDFQKSHLAHLLEAYENVALHYRDHNQYDKAIAFFGKASKRVHEDFYRMKASANLAVTYNKMHKPHLALPNTLNALAFFARNSSKSSSYLGLMATKAELLQQLSRDKEALLTLDTLYSTILNKKVSSSSFGSIKLSSFMDRVSHTQIVIFIKTANVFHGLYQQGKQMEHLQTAHHFYTLASSMFTQYYSREFYNSWLDDLNKQINQGLFQTAIYLGAKADKTALLNMAENNICQHLWKKFISRHSQNVSVPDSLLSKRNILVAALTIDPLNKNNKTKRELEQLDAQINKHSSSLISFAGGTFSAKQVQEKLSKNELAIRYFVADSCMFAFSISHNSIQLFNLGSIDGINNLVAQMKQEVISIGSNYKSISTKLYNALVQPVFNNTETPKRLTIVPDGSLNFLPFEILQGSKQNAYLVSLTHISYSYSLPLWLLQQRAATMCKGTVAFAPSYPQMPEAAKETMATRGNLYDLKNARNEAQTIAEMNHGQFFGNEQATAQNFLQSMGKFGIYHLAMHAIANNDEPENSNLVFANNEKLYFKQLYQLNLPSQMVVLSACNTGIGAMESGEGLISLSRALTYSGVQTSIYSLWEVPDQETSEIMVLFYQYLSKGQHKDEALSNAKRTFLQNNPAKQHPFYWAGFVANGNMEPIKTKQSFWWWAGGAACLLSMVAIAFSKRKKAVTVTA